MKLWEGRFSTQMSKDADAFNQSLPFDKKLYRVDITASIAHASMLGKCGIIPSEESETIVQGLKDILNDIENGLPVEGAEDIHSFVENELVRRVGKVGKKLHTARSRNDQVATDMRLYVRESCNRAVHLLGDMINALLSMARGNVNAVMPGYTHLKKAQPINVAQYFNAYSEMFLRDIDRFENCRKRLNVMPLGSAALAGTSYPVDREMTRSALGFDCASENSLDAVSDRDFVAEYLFCASLAMTHLSRLCEDTILYSSDEFGYWELPDEYCTGSSIMPQKKNPDLPELVRGKTGRVYGSLVQMLTVLKSLPLAYDKDLQEDKEGFFDAENTLFSCLTIYTALVPKIKINYARCFEAAGEGYSTATDIADYLAKKGVPFRDAHAITGKIVQYCVKKNIPFSALSLETFQGFSPVFEKDILLAIETRSSAEARSSKGGSSTQAARKGIISIRARLRKYL